MAVFKLGSILGVLLFTSVGLIAEVRLADRHMLMLQPVTELMPGNGYQLMLQISYGFGVRNDGDTPQTFKTPVLVPANSLEFYPIQGVEESEIITAGNGEVFIEKMVPPGLQLVVLGFMVRVDRTYLDLNLKAPYGMTNLAVMAPTGKVSLSGVNFKPGQAPMGMQGMDAILLQNPIDAGQTFKFRVADLPEGRGSYYRLGFGIFLALIVIGGALTVMTRQKDLKVGAEV